MKIVQPILQDSSCHCPVEDYLIELDAYGITRMFCEEHGDLIIVDKIEFDSLEEWERWKNEQETSSESS